MIWQGSMFEVPPVAHCERCGRSLTNPKSRAQGIGPVCIHKRGGAGMNQVDGEFYDIPLPRSLEEGIILQRWTDGRVATNVPHLVTHHSPSGFEFGYGGSGPADLALNAVEAILQQIGYAGPRMACWRGDCWELSYTLHQEFKWLFVAGVDRMAGTVIPWDVARTWVYARIPERQPLLAVTDLPEVYS